MFASVLIDTILGIYTTIKLNGKASFKSHFLFNIVIKLGFYFATIMLAHGISIAFFGSVLFGIIDFIPKIITALWLYIEIKSMDETSMKLGNRSFWVIVKEFISKLKTLKSDINKITEDEKEI
ncbi:phage holin family protein [Flavobacterium sp. AC]|uniref:Phage holin family protein n=2 Tax=Flavobacterium azizsancarii TaxID=2961580 RepID=A0ABT4W8V3_9FLAO|nr:phage holin family protein [Flavobacterium azizsancarii]